MVVALFACALLALAPAALAHRGHKKPDRYTIANHCWTLKATGGAFVAKDASGYIANAQRAGAERFFLKPTQLGMYLVYDRARGFLAAGNGNTVETATEPSPATEWVVRGRGPGLTLFNRETTRQPARRRRQAGSSRAAGPARPASSSASPRAARPTRRSAPTRPAARSARRTGYTEVRGTIDDHLHIGAYEFLGGGAHCGRPFHRYGAPYALVDCPDHGPGGNTAVFENATYEDSVGGHDTVGWPTFRDWPHPLSQTHEQTYYKWMERAWLARHADHRQRPRRERGPLPDLPLRQAQPGVRRHDVGAPAGQADEAAAELHRRAVGRARARAGSASSAPRGRRAA